MITKGKLFIAIMMSFLQFCSIIGAYVALSRSPDGTKQILVYVVPFGDAVVYLMDTDSGKKTKLFDFFFDDYNERILKFCWSLDGSKIAWLITNSNYEEYTYGRRLIVYDISRFPEEVNKIFDDHTHEIIDFQLSDEKLTYLYANEENYLEYEFKIQ